MWLNLTLAENLQYLSFVLSHDTCFTAPWTAACQAPLPLGILQAWTLHWVAMPSSRGSSQPRDQIEVSRIAGGFFTIWATREAQNTEWIAYPFSRGTSQPRDWTEVLALKADFSLAELPEKPT